MNKFLVFQFNSDTQMYFTRVESEYKDDTCKHFIFEVAIKGGSATSVLISERFEIFEWNIPTITDELKYLHDFKIQQVKINNDEGQGTLILKLTNEKKVDIIFEADDFTRVDFDLSFRIQADQTIIQQFIMALSR